MTRSTIGKVKRNVFYILHQYEHSVPQHHHPSSPVVDNVLPEHCTRDVSGHYRNALHRDQVIEQRFSPELGRMLAWYSSTLRGAPQILGELMARGWNLACEGR